MNTTRIVSLVRPLTLAMAFTVLSSAVLAAESSSSDLSYSYLQVTYGNGEVDDIDSDIWNIGVSLAVVDQIYLTAFYQDTDFDTEDNYSSFEQKAFGFGVGLRMPIAASADFIAEATYLNGTTSIDQGYGRFHNSESDNGYALTLGLRAMASEKIEIGLGIQYVDIFDGNEKVLTMGADYFVSKDVSLGLHYLQGASDINTLSLNARYIF